MSRLVVPRDLNCFATCDRAAPELQSSDEAAAMIARDNCWCIPELWKVCITCHDLRKAEVSPTPGPPTR